MTENNREYIKYLVNNEVPLNVVDSTKRVVTADKKFAEIFENPLASDEELQAAVKQSLSPVIRQFVVDLKKSGD